MSGTAPELTRPDGSRLRVLVVDDEQNIAELLGMALRYEGWDTTLAYTAAGRWPPPRRSARTRSCST